MSLNNNILHYKNCDDNIKETVEKFLDEHVEPENDNVGWVLYDGANNFFKLTEVSLADLFTYDKMNRNYKLLSLENGFLELTLFSNYQENTTYEIKYIPNELETDYKEMFKTLNEDERLEFIKSLPRLKSK